MWWRREPPRTWEEVLLEAVLRYGAVCAVQVSPAGLPMRVSDPVDTARNRKLAAFIGDILSETKRPIWRDTRVNATVFRGKETVIAAVECGETILAMQWRDAEPASFRKAVKAISVLGNVTWERI